jgi:hypothetical protein
MVNLNLSGIYVITYLLIHNKLDESLIIYNENDIKYVKEKGYEKKLSKALSGCKNVEAAYEKGLFADMAKNNKSRTDIQSFKSYLEFKKLNKDNEVSNSGVSIHITMPPRDRTHIKSRAIEIVPEPNKPRIDLKDKAEGSEKKVDSKRVDKKRVDKKRLDSNNE